MSRFGVAGRPSCCRLLVALVLCLTPAACADETAPSDITAPGPVTGLSVWDGSSTETSVSLHWTNPTDADFTGVMIRRAVGATPPATANAGTLVSDVTDLPGQHVPYIQDVGGIIAGTQYSYALFAHDGANNYAAAVAVTYSTSRSTPDTSAPGPVKP